MKELDSFTVERLEEILNFDLPRHPAALAEIVALARIALAAKRADPVYQYHTGIINEEGGIDWYWMDCDKGFYSQYDNQHRRIVYTTPQLNSPEIPDGWNGTLETAAKLIDLCRTYTILGDSGSYKERTINDCELTMQEIESYLAAAPEKENG
ncbi:TPA: hypothetical protein PXN96_003871 [Yersinia enterocolitica]|nr:hypothetical protein [Yersinia enterocolitica]